VTGPAIQVTIWDVCTTNEITSAAITQTITTPVLQSNSMRPTQLPWSTKFATEVCGNIEYAVYLQGEDSPSSWTTIDASSLVITASPTLDIAPGTYTLDLVARIDTYRNITKSQAFTVTVEPCQTGLDLTGLALANQQRIWYQSSLSYPIGSVLNAVTRSSSWAPPAPTPRTAASLTK